MPLLLGFVAGQACWALWLSKLALSSDHYLTWSPIFFYLHSSSGIKLFNHPFCLFTCLLSNEMASTSHMGRRAGMKAK